MMSNALDFPGGKPTNNYYNSSDNDGHPTTSRVFNSAKAGRGHPPTYNQAISSCYRRTTRHLYIGLPLSSRKPIQGKMASSELSLLESLREFSNVPLQEFVPYRV